MAFRYGYFDSEIIGIDDEGMPIFDRAETTDLFSLLFAMLVSDGVMVSPSTCFMVRAAGNGLNLELDPGFGMVKGHFCYNDEVGQLAIGTAPQKYNRIDRVVMRCNYLQRMVEIIVKTGDEAENPVPPELTRPAAGDYFELCLANIRLTAGQKIITQSSITDTRADSSVCGFITNLVNRLDTAVLFGQLNAFYDEFVDKSNTSYKEFVGMAQTAYDNFTQMMDGCYTELTQRGENLYTQYEGYINGLKAKGDSDLAAITQQLIDFRNTNEAKFLEWFEMIKGIFETDPGGEMMKKIAELTEQVEFNQMMITTGKVLTGIATSDGDYIVDSMGNQILIGWPICKCNAKKEDER